MINLLLCNLLISGAEGEPEEPGVRVDVRLHRLRPHQHRAGAHLLPSLPGRQHLPRIPLTSHKHKTERFHDIK